MAMFCKEVQEWVEEEIEQPIEEWENQQQERCEEQDCNWWCACCNKWLCWMVWVLVKVIRWVFVTVGKWVSRIVCEFVNFVLDVAALVVNLILSIPIIGGIIRTILNWVTEIVWRLVGLVDFGLSLVGIRLRKRMYVGVIIPRQNGKPIAAEADILPQIQKATEIYDTLCNVKLVYAGTCFARLDAPDDVLQVGCDVGGFFSDWWLGGSYIEFVSAFCKFFDGWRRVVGYGAEIIVLVVANVGPDDASSDTVGCSFVSTHNYVVVQTAADLETTAHEIGHSCWLPHDESDSTNLMWGSSLTGDATLTNLQIATIRWSKHCVYF